MDASDIEYHVLQSVAFNTPIKIKFLGGKDGWSYTSLTVGKTYIAVGIVDWLDGEKRYELEEDDHDEQEYKDVELFEVIQ